MTKQQIRKKADKLLQDYIRLKHNKCWVCEKEPVSCGHHFIPVSNSSATRFYLPNIIPICKGCHYLVHSQPHLVEPKISFKLGEKWYNDLLEKKRQPVKFTKAWAKEKLAEMEKLFSN